MSASWKSSIPHRLPLLAITVMLSLMATEGCIRSASDTEQKEFEAYIGSINPVMQRHADTTEEGNNANLYFQQQFPGQSPATQLQLLNDYITVLKRAVPRLREDVDEVQRIAPPIPAIPFHKKFIEALIYDHTGMTETLMFYEGVAATGVGDPLVLEHANSQFLKGRLAIAEGTSLLRSLVKR